MYLFPYISCVVFDDGDERTLRRTSLCLKGERHFNESEVGDHDICNFILELYCMVYKELSNVSLLQTLDHLPLTDPENFGTPVVQVDPV